MRLRLTFGRVVWLDLVLFEVEDDGEAEPDAVHDVSTGHEIGFSAPTGWREPVREQED